MLGELARIALHEAESNGIKVDGISSRHHPSKDGLVLFVFRL